MSIIQRAALTFSRTDLSSSSLRRSDTVIISCGNLTYDSNPTMPSALDWFVPPTRFRLNPVTQLVASLR